MTDLPSGTVTTLFTDIEGSTRLLQRLGIEAYREELELHRQALRAAFARHGGHEVEMQGDGFHVAFARASDAVAAAAEVQRALQDADWPHGEPICVRVGIHTGEPSPAGDLYVGLDIHRAARVMAAAHGGQVLVSETTAALAREELPHGVVMYDLGEHRLKDLSQPLRLYQLGTGDFPPLKTLHQTNLPVPPTPFLGREREISEVSALLAREDVRLVTLTGPGGSGKTRLALQAAGAAADVFVHGLWWVPLASLRDPALVIDATAQALGAKTELAEHVGDKRLLLLFDNFEHVIAAAREVARLLALCPRLTVLVTSRELLRLDGEWEYAVDPLREREAIALFEMRARAVRRDFAANGEVAEICARVDNLPLAIELAAAHVKMLSPAALLERLDRRLPTLARGTRDAPERQRTLRATIEWSHELLMLDEQQLFRRLAVFAGGATLSTIESVTGGDFDTLASLADKSLVRVRNGQRYWMLETIREYAAEQLQRSGEADDIQSRHAEHFVALAEAAQPNFLSADQRAWLERLDLELDNVRAAITWLAELGESALELRIVGALGRFWLFRGHLEEGLRRIEAALASGAEQSAELRERPLYGAAILAHRLGDYARAKAHAEECLVLCRAIGDPERIARALGGLGLVAYACGETAAATAAFLESAELAGEAGRREPGPNLWEMKMMLAMALNDLGVLAVAAGDDAEAQRRYEEGLVITRELGEAHMSGAILVNLALLAYWQGRTEDAEALLHEALDLAQTLTDRETIIECFEGLAAVAASRNEGEHAATLLGAADVLREETGHAPQPPLPGRDKNEQTRKVLAACDDERVAAARAQGREMTLDQAIAFARST